MTEHLKTTRPAKKLDHKWEGPFNVIKHIGNDSYKIELPSSIKVRNSFYTSLLRLSADNPILRQVPPPAPPVIVKGTEE